MIVLIYTRAYEVGGDRAPQWAGKGTNVFMLNVLFVNFSVNIKIPMKKDIFLRYNYEILRCLCAWLCGFTASSMTGAGLSNFNTRVFRK